jgi:hypothetical protein
MIIGELVAQLKPMKSVRAFWEGGAIAFQRLDRWSDLDLYLLVKRGSEGRAFLRVERALRGLSPISGVYEVTAGFGGVKQKFYRLTRANEFAVIDLAVLTEDSQEKFLTPEIHGRNVFYFNKDGLEPPPLDWASFRLRREGGQPGAPP